MGTILHRWRPSGRASQACLRCRARKVKCDVDEGKPCKNCQVDEEQCLIGDKRRGRPSKALETKRRESMCDGDMNRTHVVGSSHQPLPAVHTVDWLPAHASRNMESQYSEEEMTESQLLMAKHFLSRSPDEASLPALLSLSRHRNLGNDALANGMATLISAPSPESTRLDVDERPPFIKTLSGHLTSDDIQYLRTKGALRLPSISLRDAIICAYVQYVHPFLPFLDLSQFLEASFNNGLCPPQQISILLFQAVMFAAVVYVDADTLQREGFESPRHAANVLFDKVRLLYDFDVESDQLTNIQALLLMSSYHSKVPGDSKRDWHWMGAAISLAHTIGLHRVRDYQGLSAHECRLRRRTWWSCFVRDRLMAVSLSRLMRIRDGEYDTPMLTPDDFDFSHSDNELNKTVLNSVGVDLMGMKRLVEISTQTIQLCRMAGFVLSLSYSAIPEMTSDPTSDDKTGGITPMLFQRSQQSRAANLRLYDDQLQLWYSHLPSYCTYPLSTPTISDLSRVDFFHAAILNLIFFAVVSALHRPALHQNAVDQVGDDNDLSRRRIFEAAVKLSKIDHALHKAHLDRFLPGTMVPIQFPAIVVLSSGLRSSSDQRVGENLERVVSCLRIIESLQDVYVGTDVAVSIVQAILARAGARVHIGDNSHILGVTYNNQSCLLDPRSTLQPETTHQVEADLQTCDSTMNISEPEAFETFHQAQVQGYSVAEPVHENSMEDNEPLVMESSTGFLAADSEMPFELPVGEMDFDLLAYFDFEERFGDLMP